MKSPSFRALLGLMPLLALSLHAGAVKINYGQTLIDDIMRKNPDLVVSALHVTAPGESENKIIATNLDRIGKVSDPDDLEVVQTNKPMYVPNLETKRSEVLIPLRDVNDQTIGTLGLVWATIPGKPEEYYIDKAIAIRNWLRLVTPSVKVLFDPYIKGSVPTDTLGQKLVMLALERHPEMHVIGLHITPPGGKANLTVAINRPNFIGHESDEFDTGIEKTGNIFVDAFAATHRAEVHMPLRAANGALVGTITTVYLWEKEVEMTDFYSRSIALRDELQPLIPSYEALFKP